MKKKFFSMLLVVCMVAALFTGLGASAYADDTFKYTVKSGDTLWGLCQSKGLNYYTCKNAIKTLNGFTSDYELSHIGVGDTITLPISDAVATTLGASGSTTTSTTTTVSGSTTTSTTTTTNALANGDVISYYLVAHTMAKGETVQAIYSAWGLSYKTYSDQILALNSLKGFNKMYAGKTYVFPAPTVPAGSTAAYSVVAHKVASGDSAYNLCNSYNTNYNKQLTLVKSLNGGSDLTKIKAGQIVYIPAAGTLAATGAGGTTGGSTGTVTPGATVTGSAYAVNKATVKNGSFITKVGSSEVTSAKSGSSVTIVTTPNAGYVVDSIVVSKADDASTTVATNSSVFTMPAYAVKVSVSFKLASTITSGVAHKINISATNGTASAISDGSAVTTAKAGTFVTVVPTANKGYTLDSVKVTYNNYASNVPVASNAFNMPDSDVNVVVTFKALPTFDITWLYTSNGHGMFSTKVGGAQVKKAMAGETVTIDPTPDAGYAVDKISVTYSDGTAVSMIDAYSFVMPAQAVRVGVSFAGSSNIKTAKLYNGTVSYKVDGVGAVKAVAGKLVTVIPAANTGYVVSGISVKNGTNTVTTTSQTDGSYTFTMPAAEVTVDVSFEKVATYALTAAPAGSLRFMVNGGYVTSAAKDAVVTVVAGSLAEGKKLGTLTSSDCTIDTTNNTFKMPGKAVTVNANLADIAVRTISVNFDSAVSKLVLLVDGKAVAPATTSSFQNTYSILEGKSVTVEATCSEGYALSEVSSAQVKVNDADIFVVGATDAVIDVKTRGQYRSIMSADTVNGSFTLVDADGNPVTNTAAAGSAVYIRPVANKGYELDKIYEKFLNTNGTTASNKIEADGSGLYKFTMPGADVTLEVTFKAKALTVSYVLVDAAGVSSLKLKYDGKVYDAATHGTPKSLTALSFSEVKIMPVILASYQTQYEVTSVEILDASDKSIKSKVSYDDTEMSFKTPSADDYSVITVKVTIKPIA